MKDSLASIIFMLLALGSLTILMSGMWIVSMTLALVSLTLCVRSITRNRRTAVEWIGGSVVAIVDIAVIAMVFPRC